MMLNYEYIDGPVGKLLLVGKDEVLYQVGFPKARRAVAIGNDWVRTTKGLGKPIRQLESYFARRLIRFDLRLELHGTRFQTTVWRELASIPYGETISYAELARRIHRPKAVRAVGAANGANPIPIVLPCHRVVGASGDLVGFGGGLETKRALLRLEGCKLPSVATPPAKPRLFDDALPL